MGIKYDEILPYKRKPLTLHSDITDIIYHLQGKQGYEQLSPALEEKLKRMQQTRDYLSKYGSRIKVVPMLMTDFNIARRMAYRLMEETMEVFNTMAETKGRDMWVDIILDKVFETWRKAHAKEDFKTAAICEGRMIEIIEKFMGGEMAKLYEGIQPPVFQFGFFPELTNVTIPDDLEHQINKIIKQKVSGSRYFEKYAEDAEILGDDGWPTE